MEVSSSATLFSPASSCVTDVYWAAADQDSCDDGYGSTFSCRYFHLGPQTSLSDCFPPGWQSSSGAFISTTECPLEYERVITFTTALDTAVICCPNNYGYQGIGIDFKYQMTELCYRSLSSGESVVYTTSTLGAGFQTIATTLDSGGVNAYGVEIRWRVSSPASATTFTTSDLHLSGVSSSTSSTTETSAARTLDSEPAPQRIPAGAGAGIGIGAAAATALILVGLFLLWRRKRKHRTRQTPAHDTLPLGGNLRPVDRISGYTGSDRSNSARPTQLQSHYSTEWSEMRHASPPVELGSA
ncbi:hypothetical protein K445DRAFT_215355 [Daldinia sp. EC12]|nr:hypothetical protein K445DRAFT_215355 [Daldinia sp. EC12]